MKWRAGIDRGKRDGETLRATCGRCNGETRHEVVQSVYVSGKIDGCIDFVEDYQIIQCRGCEDVSFRKNHRNSEDLRQVGDEEVDMADHVDLFPPRLAGRPVLANSQHLPLLVLNIYEETHKALCMDQRVLAGIGIRALVEAVCAEQGAMGRNLQKKVERLVELNVLTRKGADILHAVRFMGNQAAHEMEPPGTQDLGVAMDVAEHLLTTVYIIPKRAERLMKKVPVASKPDPDPTFLPSA